MCYSELATQTKNRHVRLAALQASAWQALQREQKPLSDLHSDVFDQIADLLNWLKN